MGKLAARDNVVNQLSESLRAGSQNLVTTFARIGVVCCGATRWWRERSWKNSDLVRCPMDREVGSRVKNARRGCCAAGRGCGRVSRPDARGSGGSATNGSNSVEAGALPQRNPPSVLRESGLGCGRGFGADAPKPKAGRAELPPLRAAMIFVVAGPSGPTRFAQLAAPAWRDLTRAAHPAAPLRSAAALPLAANGPGPRTPPASPTESRAPRHGRVADTARAWP